MSMKITILKQNMLGIQNKVQRLQIRRDSMAIYEMDINRLEFNVKS